jgi:hypothetical protein
MVSRENTVVAAFGSAALALAYAGSALTSIDQTVLLGVLLFVGVVVPTLVNEHLDGREEDAGAA